MCRGIQESYLRKTKNNEPVLPSKREVPPRWDGHFGCRRRPQRVRFRESVEVYDYDRGEEDQCWSSTWYDKSDYARFAANRKLDILTYRRMHQGSLRWTRPRGVDIRGNGFDHNNRRNSSADTALSDFCTRGLENYLTRARNQQMLRRKTLVVEAVLDEQLRQQEEGIHDPELLAHTTSLYTLICKLEAQDRANSDAAIISHTEDLDLEMEEEDDDEDGDDHAAGDYHKDGAMSNQEGRDGGNDMVDHNAPPTESERNDKSMTPQDESPTSFDVSSSSWRNCVAEGVIEDALVLLPKYGCWTWMLT